MFIKKKNPEIQTSSSDESSEQCELENDLFWSSSESDVELIEQRCRIENFMENTVPGYSDEEFKSHFRLSRHAMEHVENLFKSEFQIAEGYHGGRPPISAKKGVHFFIWYLANQETFRQICDRFNVSQSTGFELVKKISLKFKADIAKNYIKFPQPQAFSTYAESFRRKKNLKNIIGAIDCSHISIKRPKENEADFVNRKGFHSVLLQATCDSERRFIDIYVGEPGSLHDARVLKKSPLYHQLQDNPNYMNSYCLLGDSAYPVLPWLIPPYKDTGHLTREQNNFNYAHSATRVVIENAFGLLKGRFRRLRHFDNLRIDIILNCIISACVLHNICIDLNDQFEEDIDYETDANGDNIDSLDNIPSGENRRQQLFNEFLSAHV